MKSLNLKIGLHPYVLPDLGTRNQYGNLNPPTQEQVLEQLEELCQQLTQDGAMLIGILSVTVDCGKRAGVSNNVEEQKQILIIET